MNALTDLFGLVKLLSETVAVIVTKIDDPALTAFWDQEWERLMEGIK